MRETSRDSYVAIREQGLLSKRRFQVYEVLFNHGPLTAGEIWAMHLKAEGAQLNSISPRTAELEIRGVIKAVGERPCRITGQRCIEWDVTSRLPVEPPKKAKRTICSHCEGHGWIDDSRPPKGQLSLFGGAT